MKHKQQVRRVQFRRVKILNEREYRTIDRLAYDVRRVYWARLDGMLHAFCGGDETCDVCGGPMKANGKLWVSRNAELAHDACVQLPTGTPS